MQKKIKDVVLIKVYCTFVAFFLIVEVGILIKFFHSSSNFKLMRQFINFALPKHFFLIDLVVS